MASLREMLENVLKDLKSVGDVEASAIVSRDGLLIAADIPQSVNAEAFAAMTATMLGAAETATSELGKGIPDRVIVEGKDGKIIATGAGSKALLVAMTTPKANLGLVLLELGRASEKVKELLKG
ncbi:roadblock/LC7 domain-containing protein [Archaeoglobus veneficus]|uniref:Roadblock/LC7 family protein n=1 Tax=Archaeoglobus veneficus (strain DSM 11195 / SNP6) TaxID=693661 RepID=F2KQ29_ARCVS|nr:roadblock/LC7 domain-containing protein [Archaeoglobus veneficus]AEA47632.1 Roadblock/LC7 family protein [Archaeoglobus veneficus SNP6]